MARVVKFFVWVALFCMIPFTVSCRQVGGDVAGFQIPLPSPVVNSVASFQNADHNFDVNNDTHVSPLDALIVINNVHVNGIRLLSNSDLMVDEDTGENKPPYFWDVDGDGWLNLPDAILVIEYLNGNYSGGSPSPTARSSSQVFQYAARMLDDRRCFYFQVSYYQNFAGRNGKWFRGRTIVDRGTEFEQEIVSTYTILPNGTVYQVSSTSADLDELIGKFPSTYWDNPEQLLDAGSCYLDAVAP